MLAVVAVAAAVLLSSSQDTVVVRADDIPKWGEHLLLIEELRIGGRDENGRNILGVVEGVAVTPDGVMWVADGAHSNIRRYDALGQYLGQVGSAGDGPAQFRRLDAIDRLSGGQIVAWDPALARATLFDNDGAVSRTLPVDLPVYTEHSSYLETFRADNHGQFYMQGGHRVTLRFAHGRSARSA